MKKLFAITALAMMLAFTGCPVDDDGDSNTDEAKTTLAIKNESSFDLADVQWNGTVFGNITRGNTVSKTVAAGLGAIRMKLQAGAISARGQEPVSLEEGESRTVIFTNNTVVLEEPGSTSFTLAALAGRLAKPSKPVLRAGDRKLRVIWTAVENATAYRVYCGTDAAPPVEPSVSVDAPAVSAVVAGLANETTYNVWVRAVNGTGVSELSEMAQAAPTVNYTANSAATFRAAVEAINEADDGDYTITLTGSFSAGQTAFTSGNSKTVTLTGASGSRTISNDSTATTGAFLSAASGITLILESGATLSGNNKTVPVVGVGAGATLIMKDGSKIMGAKASGVRTSGTFNMEGGTISSNMNESNGGGVYVVSGTFTMNGGTISGNNAKTQGGGVYVQAGIFEMEGGSITANTAQYTYSSYSGSLLVGWGGGVYVAENGSFIKTGGVIDDTNQAEPSSLGGSHYGDVAYISSGLKRRNSTAGETDNLNSSIAGSAGGWE